MWRLSATDRATWMHILRTVHAAISRREAVALLWLTRFLATASSRLENDAAIAEGAMDCLHRQERDHEFAQLALVRTSAQSGFSRREHRLCGPCAGATATCRPALPH